MKKLIEMFALVAVVSLVGCGAGSGGGEKNEDQSKKNEVVTLEGKYKASRYECQDGTNYLDTLGKTGSMTFDVAKEELTLTLTKEKKQYTLGKIELDGLRTRTVVLNASFTDSTLAGKDVKSFSERNFVPGVDESTLAARHIWFDGTDFENFEAKYTLKDKTVTFTIDKDVLCGGQSSVVTADRI